MPLRGHYESLWVHCQTNQRIKCTSMSNIKHRGVQTWKRLNSKCVTKRLIKLHLSLNRNWILKVNESDFHGSNLCTGLIYSWPPATPISNLWTASCRPQKVGYKWKPPRHRHRTAGILFAYTHTHTLRLSLEQVQKYKHVYVAMCVRTFQVLVCYLKRIYRIWHYASISFQWTLWNYFYGV